MIDKLFNKYTILVYLIFILSFLSIWNPDNINDNNLEFFQNKECPRKYMDRLLKIAKSDGKVNQNINDMETDYELNAIDVMNNKSGSAIYKGKFPRERNYNFAIKSKKDNSKIYKSGIGHHIGEPKDLLREYVQGN